MRRLVKIASVILLLVSLSGCGMTFVYNNLSLLTPWLVDDFISLNSDQKKLYQSQLKTLHDWHRQHELPEYRALLLSILDDLDDQKLNTENFAEHLLKMRRRWEVMVEQAIPAITDMALTLSDQQVDELMTKLEKSNLERLEDDEDRSLRQRQRSMLRNVKDWMGKLTDHQTALVEGSVEPENQNTLLTVAAHRRFQEQLGELLRQRSSDNFKPALAALLSNPLISPEGDALTDYRMANFTQRIELYSQLWASASDKQKAKIRSKLQGYIDDIDTLVKQ